MSEASKKYLIQEILPTEKEALLATVQDLKTGGYRLGQACATALGDNLELLYSFEKDNVLKNLKVGLPAFHPEIQSITGIYPYAFIYENEMHDLFGVAFKNLNLDYKGEFFQMAETLPWNPNYAKKPEPVATVEPDVIARSEATRQSGDESNPEEASEE